MMIIDNYPYDENHAKTSDFIAIYGPINSAINRDLIDDSFEDHE